MGRTRPPRVRPMTFYDPLLSKQSIPGEAGRQQAWAWEPKTARHPSLAVREGELFPRPADRGSLDTKDGKVSAPRDGASRAPWRVDRQADELPV